MASSSWMDAFGGEDSASDEDLGLDDSFDEDMEALKRACMLTGTNPNGVQSPHSTSAASGGSKPDSGSDTDDLELVRSIQQRFNLSSLSINQQKSRSIGTFSDSDDEDDFETLRAIQRRFVQYDADGLKNNSEKPLQTVGITAVESTSNTLVGNKNNGEPLGGDFPDSDDAHANSQPLQYFCNRSDGIQLSGVTEKHSLEDGTSNLSLTPLKNSSLPDSAQLFITALKKNRSCQKLVRSKLLQIEARIEEIKELRRRFKHLLAFQVACKKRAGKVLSQPKDPRIGLIALPKARASKELRASKKVKPVDFGPDENSQVANYRAALEKFPASLRRQPWSKVERENLAKGIKQQFQEMLLQKSMENYSEEDSSGVLNVDSIIASINDLEMTSEDMRSFLPRVDWERLSSMYVMGRSGAECQTRWLNIEDPMINHNPWDKLEDKSLLFICQDRGIYNWIEIAALLKTNRTPCQCLARYQRSLNAFILKRDWTEEEDAQLRAVVETVGENDWQRVASILGGRTGPQCSNRWLKTLHPSRKRVGRWMPDEDKRLKIAVMLFGQRTWKKIAQFVPGRTQVQCRERWVNTLDPSLNLEPWTEEEDCKLKTAIADHGYCWSKIAAMVFPRTDSQCRRRWKVLFPHEVPLLQAERRIQRVALISNFVDREEQRPAIGPSDFVATFSSEMNPLSQAEGEDNSVKRKMKTSDDPQPKNTKVSKKKATNSKKTSRSIDSSNSTVLNKGQKRNAAVNKTKVLLNGPLGLASGLDVDASHGDVNIEKKRVRKRSANSQAQAQAHPQGSLGISECIVANDVTPTAKKRKKQTQPKLLTECDCSIQPVEGHGDQQHSKHSILEVGQSVDTSLEGNCCCITVEDASWKHPSIKLKDKACLKEVMYPPDSDGIVFSSRSYLNGKVAVSHKFVQRSDGCGVGTAENTTKDPSRDSVNSDDETLFSVVHKQLKRRNGGKPPTRTKKVLKIIPNKDSHTQLAEDQENVRSLGCSDLDVVDTRSRVLNEKPRIEDGMCGVWTTEGTAKDPSRKQTWKHKGLPEEVLDAPNSDDEILISVIHKQLRRQHGDKHQDLASENIPTRGNKEVPKLIPDRDSHTQFREDGIQAVLLKCNGIADDALLVNGEAAVDQVGGTYSMVDDASLNQLEGKRTSKFARREGCIHPVEDHETRLPLDPPNWESIDTNDSSILQSKAIESSILNNFFTGEHVSSEISGMHWVAEKGRGMQSPALIRESLLNDLENVQTASAVDCMQQWSEEEPAEERLAELCSSLEGWDIIEPARDGGEP